MGLDEVEGLAGVSPCAPVVTVAFAALTVSTLVYARCGVGWENT